mgnify:CR=1 FL=1
MSFQLQKIQKETKLSIIIVNYNTLQLTCRCLDSVFKYLKEVSFLWEVILIDNGSTDGSVEAFMQYRNLFIIENPDNRGFSKANNQGILRAKGVLILLLNSDVIVTENSFSKLVEIAEKHDNLGALGCTLRNLDGSLQATISVFPNLLSIFLRILNFSEKKPLNYFLRKRLAHHNKFYSFIFGKTISSYLFSQSTDRPDIEHVDWITGACFLIPQNVIDKIGLLDEDFFMYAEDVDWCKRILRNGFTILRYNKTSMIHDTNRYGDIRFKKLSSVRLKSIILFYKKYYG